MLMTIGVTESIHLAALRSAREVGRDKPLPAGLLNAPLDDDSRTWIDDIWDKAETALKRAYKDGMAAARPYIDKATALLGQAAEAVGKAIGDVHAVVMERLNRYLKDAIDGALAQVRPFVSIGGEMLRLRKVTLEQKVTLSGSVKASLEEICEFVAEGEVNLATEYGSAD